MAITHAKAAWDAVGCVFQPVSECILRLQLKCHMSYMTVLAGPSEAFNDQLQTSLSSIPSSPCHISSDVSSWNSLIAPHGVGECNENGDQLLDFCASNQLIITNTWFQHKLLHKATWFRNGHCSRTGHMIDHVQVNIHSCTSVSHWCVLVDFP